MIYFFGMGFLFLRNALLQIYYNLSSTNEAQQHKKSVHFQAPSCSHQIPAFPQLDSELRRGQKIS